LPAPLCQECLPQICNRAGSFAFISPIMGPPQRHHPPLSPFQSLPVPNPALNSSDLCSLFGIICLIAPHPPLWIWGALCYAKEPSHRGVTVGGFYSYFLWEANEYISVRSSVSLGEEAGNLSSQFFNLG
jgi:hypothetical protein